MDKIWKQYLPGIEEGMPEEIYLLAEIFKAKAFELHFINTDVTGEMQIPYMMNDALECYLILKNARIKGTFQKKMEEETYGELIREENDYMLIIHQGEENVLSLWFTDIEKKLECYRYDEIGHFWREGAEQWRQLVYIAGTICDKYEYIGEEVCNSLELELMRLMEFAPFRYWSPIKESIDEFYEDTTQGYETILTYAIESKDFYFERLLKLYHRFPNKCTKYAIIRAMMSEKRIGLYEFICGKIKEASCQYKIREYDSKTNDKIRKMREQVDVELKSDGYDGQYPKYYKEHHMILATEEHPFTLMEAEDFTFKIQLMESVCREKTPMLNAGFFHGRGRTGKIRSRI